MIKLPCLALALIALACTGPAGPAGQDGIDGQDGRNAYDERVICGSWIRQPLNDRRLDVRARTKWNDPTWLYDCTMYYTENDSALDLGIMIYYTASGGKIDWMLRRDTISYHEPDSLIIADTLWLR